MTETIAKRMGVPFLGADWVDLEAGERLPLASLATFANSYLNITVLQ